MLGIEPARNVAAAAEARGHPDPGRASSARRLARELVAEGTRADLLVGNNVLAHVPGPQRLRGRARRSLLAPGGVLTIEFPHLLRLMDENQFDTIYHEHFSYFSFATVRKVFAAHGLTLFDVEELPTHGGSLRIYARHDARRLEARSSRGWRTCSRARRPPGSDGPDATAAFAEQVRRVKRACCAS